MTPELRRLRMLVRFQGLPWYRRAWLTLTGKIPMAKSCSGHALKPCEICSDAAYAARLVAHNDDGTRPCTVIEYHLGQCPEGCG